MDHRKRKLITMHKALHPRDDIDRLHISRKEGGRGFASIEETKEKLKETEKRNKYLDLARELKTMEHESDGDTNCN